MKHTLALLRTLLVSLAIVMMASTLFAQGITVLKSSTEGKAVNNTFSFTSAAVPPSSETFKFTNRSGDTFYNLLISVSQRNPNSYMLLKYQCILTPVLSYYEECWKTLNGKTVSFLTLDGTRIGSQQNFQIQLRNLIFKWDPSSVFKVVANVPDPRHGAAVQLKDFNGDGTADLDWKNDATGEAAIWLMDGAAVNGSIRAPVLPDANWSFIASADLNGDGRSDLVAQNSSTGDMSALINNGTSFDSFPMTAASKGHVLGVTDFNGDGKTDLVLLDPALGAIVWLMDGPAVLGVLTIAVQTQPTWEPITVADFDGNGIGDLMWRDVQSGELFIAVMNSAGGGTVVSAGVLTPLQRQIGAVADFDGDGKADILWRGLQGTLQLWKMDGVTVISKLDVQASPDLNWQIVAAGDLNGDSKTDLFWHNYLTGENRIWFMDGEKVSGVAPTTPMADPNWVLF